MARLLSSSKIMYKITSAVVALALFLSIGTAFAKGPMNKATGSIWMSDPSQSVSFNAFDAGANSASDRGSVTYANYTYAAATPEGYLTYTVPVMCATVAGDDARFMYQIPAGFPGLTGLYVLAAVHNGGTSGVEGDTYGHTATGDLATAMSWCESGVGVSNYPITAGNLQVHTY